MKVHHEDERVTLWHGDALEVLRELPDASVDAVVTDPPYGLEFMGKEWDSFKIITPTETSCATSTETAPTTPATTARPASAAPDGSASDARSAGESGGRRTDPARAASAVTLADPSEVGGFQDGAGGNPYSRSRVRTNTQRHGGDSLTANVGYGKWCEQWATECLRVLKPGGHLLAFGGTRTWHRLACAVEDAGFEVRDSIAWLHSQGFPKSLDVSKAIDKAAGAERVPIGGSAVPRRNTGSFMLHGCRTFAELEELAARGEKTPDGRDARATLERALTAPERSAITAPATPEAERWQGWGTALKPAFEPIVVARKPLVGTVVANVLAHGTGALNIDACRVALQPGEAPKGSGALSGMYQTGGFSTYAELVEAAKRGDRTPDGRNTAAAVLRRAQETWKAGSETPPAGRWPTNVVLDDSQAAELDRQSGERTSGVLAAHHTRNPKESGILGAYGSAEGERGYGDTGGASRFFPTFRYEAKASRSERPRVNGVAHPTVKPLDLMRWLVRLVTPPGGTVLEPFAGSGTTVEAAIVEGFRCIAIEREADYLPLIMQRVNRRTDPVAYLKAAGDDLGLLDFGEMGGDQ